MAGDRAAKRRVAGPVMLALSVGLALGGCAGILSPGQAGTPRTDSRTTEAPMSTDSGSSTGTDSGSSTQRSGTGELRTDLEPLTSRFPLLADAESVTWMSGTLGDDSVPGPSTYWIDAVVTLPAADAEKLAADTQPAPATADPVVESGLEAALPDGPYLTSDALDAAFSPGDIRTTAHLAADGRTLVLRSVFQ
ncbi:hypothetical protein NVV95_14240 [Herbiconiux sp. CPCC 205716]|uniref:Uncharacterized protein n=1 Tax=Herbiconiux gentiana TaxID=2970912 RepID=A0ABT2GHK4_9MICO|nr:hypothetical protein [Herbiconiux gentiana]MCS5715706.1 hypothetical protein [Herbiconiux gentiana]